MSVQAARSQYGGIDGSGMIAGGNHDDTLAAVYSIQLFEKSGNRLRLIGSVASFGPSPRTECVNFVDEQDRWSFGLGIVEASLHGFQEVVQITAGLPLGV